MSVICGNLTGIGSVRIASVVTGVRRGTNVRCGMAAGRRGWGYRRAETAGVTKVRGVRAVGRRAKGVPKSEIPTEVGLVSPGHDGYMRLFNVRELGTSRLERAPGRRGYQSPTRSSGFDQGGGTKVRTSDDVSVSTITGGIPYKCLNLRKIKSSARASTAATDVAIPREPGLVPTTPYNVGLATLHAPCPVPIGRFRPEP
jgi:hypothetical protein